MPSIMMLTLLLGRPQLHVRMLGALSRAQVICVFFLTNTHMLQGLGLRLVMGMIDIDSILQDVRLDSSDKVNSARDYWTLCKSTTIFAKHKMSPGAYVRLQVKL